MSSAINVRRPLDIVVGEMVTLDGPSFVTLRERVDGRLEQLIMAARKAPLLGGPPREPNTESRGREGAGVGPKVELIAEE